MWRVVRSLLSALCVAAFVASGTDAQSDSTRVEPQEKKSPTGAMIRSLLVPGWGQFYNGKPIKGTIVAAAEVGSVVAFFVRRDQINSEVRPVGQAPKRNFYLISSLGIVFYSVVDAFVDAHLDEFDWGQLTYRPDQRAFVVQLHRTF